MEGLFGRQASAHHTAPQWFNTPRPLRHSLPSSSSSPWAAVPAARARRAAGLGADPAGPSRPGGRLVASFGATLGRLALAADVNAPAGQAVGQAGILALLADRQRQLVVGHDHVRGLLGLVDADALHLSRRERLRHELRRVVGVEHDVDLLAAQLVHHRPHAHAAGADAGALGVDPGLVGAHGDLGPMAWLAGDVGDLDDALGDLGHLQLEQPPDQVRMGPRYYYPQAPGRAGHLGDVDLEAVVVLVVLAWHLLGMGQVRLDLAEVDGDVAGVALLHYAGHDVALATLVLAEGDVAVGLHARVVGRVGAALVGRGQRALERTDHRLERDALLALEEAQLVHGDLHVSAPVSRLLVLLVMG